LDSVGLESRFDNDGEAAAAEDRVSTSLLVEAPDKDVDLALSSLWAGD
jgi:hypothetical protein